MTKSVHLLVPKGSHVRACIYDPDEQRLRVTFHNNAVYHYDHFTALDFDHLQRALNEGDSLGRFLRNDIASNHPVRRVRDGVPILIGPGSLPPLPWRH